MISMIPNSSSSSGKTLTHRRAAQATVAFVLLASLLVIGMPGADAIQRNWNMDFGSHSTARWNGAGQQQFNWNNCTGNNPSQVAQMNLKEDVNNGWDKTYTWDNWTCGQGAGGDIGNSTAFGTPNGDYFLKWNGTGVWWTTASVNINP